MARIRVLVVDDSVVVRKLVTDVLAADPEIETVGTAANGRIALSKILQLNPDVVTLDIEMPIMDGMETLRELRKLHPKLPVIMFSTLSERGAAATLEALSLGATDYVTKPSNVGSVAIGQQRIRDELIPKIKALCGRKNIASVSTLVASAQSKPLAAAPRGTKVAPPTDGRIDVIAIGVSTGGPNALATLIPLLPADFPIPIVIVQHMPPVFTKLLAERIRKSSRLNVQEGVTSGVVERGHVWIAPGNYHMQVRRERTVVRLALDLGAPENSCRPAVDVLFRSVARTFGNRALGVVLTGMGQDGLRGSEELVDAGSRVVVQDQESSVVWGMPGFVAQAGLADRVLPLHQIADELIRRAREGRRAQTPDMTRAGSIA